MQICRCIEIEDRNSEKSEEVEAAFSIWFLSKSDRVTLPQNEVMSISDSQHSRMRSDSELTYVFRALGSIKHYGTSALAYVNMTGNRIPRAVSES